ncbi:UNVERIFIED_CONTAM: hypothetical protein GTU68_041375 [Idotea baltica]|nr:hypothetical protein [Idotea baltica]
MPYEFFLEKEVAEIIKSATADINSLINNVLIASCQLITNLVVVLLVIILLAAVQPVVALASFVFLSLSFFTIFLLRKSTISSLGKRQLKANTGRFTSFTDLLHGIKTIQSSNAHKYFYNRFDKPSFEYSNIQPKVFLNSTLPKYVIETLVFGSLILIVVYLTKSSNSLSDYLPFITLYVVAGYRLLPAINRAYVSATLILNHHHVIDPIHQDYAYAGNDAHSIRTTSSIVFENKLEINTVSFTYSGSESHAIKDVSLLIKKGSKVAFVGTSGSGKSTLGAIVVGLIQPDEGSVKIDDIERNKQHQSAWIDQIGYVPQDVFLYNGTVSDNVCFGLPVRPADVITACKIAQIHDHIVKKLPKGYDSMVGDSGIRLSGGQKQRIGIARAIYRNPELLLLDEATSALDTKTEKRIFDAINKELSEVTLVVIAHRVSTVKNSDLFLVFEEGTIVARGTFNELVENSELFKELCSYI